MFSFFLLRSTNLATGLFVVGLAVALLVMEPFVGLLIYILFIYTGPQAYVPALESLRVVLVIGMGTLGSMLARRVIRGAGTFAPGGPQTPLMIWFFTAVLVSRLSHLEFSAAVASGYDALNLLVLFTLVVRLVNTERRLHWMFVIVVVGTLALAVQGVYQHATGGEIFSFQDMEKGRVAGIGQFVNPNMLAIGLVCGIPMVFALFSRSRNLAVRVFLVASAALMVYALYLTNSRGGTLSLVVVAAVAIAGRYGIVRGLVIGAIAYAAVLHFGPSRMAELSTTEASAHGRLLAWAKGYDIFAANPIFGAGAGSWYEKYRTLVAHNSFIHCVAELGVFGLAAWTLLAFVSLKNLWYVARRRRGAPGATPLFGGAVFLSLVGFLFASLFISKTYHPLYFMLLGLSAAIVNVYTDEEGGRYVLMSGRDFVLGLGVTAVGLVAFKVFLLVVGVTG